MLSIKSIGYRTNILVSHTEHTHPTASQPMSSSSSSADAAATTAQHYRFFHNEASNEETSRILEADPKSVEYELVYFDFSCVAATPRYILSYGKAKWSDKHPKVKKHPMYHCIS